VGDVVIVRDAWDGRAVGRRGIWGPEKEAAMWTTSNSFLDGVQLATMTRKRKVAGLTLGHRLVSASASISLVGQRIKFMCCQH